jgi:hypothetical protein
MNFTGNLLSISRMRSKGRVRGSDGDDDVRVLIVLSLTIVCVISTNGGEKERKLSCESDTYVGLSTRGRRVKQAYI